MSDVRSLFCIGLVDHYAETRPDIDEKQATLIFARLGPVEATQLVVRAINAAFSDGGGQAAAAANPPAATPANGTG